MPDSFFKGAELTCGHVLPEWIDVNDHMNVAYYVLAFDQGVDAMWEELGITEDYVNVTNSSTFAVESHITWQREFSVDEPFVITGQLLAYDEKRIHQFMRMYHAEKHHLAATAEWLNLHVDLQARRVTPWPRSILERIAAFAERQDELPWPAEAGKKIHLATPIYRGQLRGSG